MLFTTCLIINFTVHFFYEIILDLILRKAEKKCNYGNVIKGSSQHNGFVKSPLVSLVPGDIVFLEKNQEIPADMLILDTSEIIDKEAVCYISNKKMNGFYISKQKACYLTALPLDSPLKGTFDKYSSILYGSVEYKRDHLKENFKGFLKLRKDPKVEVVNNENFIKRGSVLTRTRWIIGLVLFAGNDCKIMDKFHHSSSKKDVFKVWLETHYIFLFIIYIIFSLTIAFLLIGKQTLNPNFVSNIFFNFTSFFPFEGFLILKIFGFLTLISLRKKKIKIYNPAIIPNLCAIDYVFFNKTVVNDEKPARISQLYIDSKTFVLNDQSIENIYNESKIPLIENSIIYDCDIEFLSEHTPKLESNIESFTKRSINLKFLTKKNTNKTKEKKDNKFSLSLEDSMINSSGIRQNDSLISSARLTKLLTNHERKDFHNNIKEEGNLESILINSLIICHQAQAFQADSSPNFEFECNLWEDDIFLDFCKSFGYRMESIQKNENSCLTYNYSVFPKGQKRSVIILAILEETNDHKNFSIVYKKTPKSNAVILTRGRKEKILQKIILSPSEYENVDSNLSTFESKGLIPIILAQKTLTVVEEENFISQYRILKFSLINQQEQISKLFDELEYGLEYLATLGVEEKPSPFIQESLSFFRSIDSKCWLLSVHSAERVISISKRLGFLNNEQEGYSKVFSLEQTNVEDLIFTVKNILSYINEHIQTQKKKSIILKSKTVDSDCPITSIVSKTKIDREINIIINGKSLDIIIETPYLCQNFMFICSLIKSLVGYDVSTRQKTWLANMVQHHFDKRNTLLGICNASIDGQLLQTVDFGAEIKGIGLGDMEIDQIKELISFIKGSSREITFKLFTISQIILYKTFVISFESFFFQFFSDFSGEIFSLDIIFCYFFFIMSPSIFIFSYFVNGLEVAQSFFETTKLKFENFEKIKVNLPFLITESIFHAIIVFYVSSYSIRSTQNGEGKTYDLVVLEMICLINNVLLANIRLISFGIAKSKSKKMIILIVSIFALFLVLFIGSLFEIPKYKIRFSLLVRLLSDSKILFIILYNILLCSLVSFIVLTFANFIEKTMKRGNLENFQKKLIKTAKKIFKSPKYMDPLIQEMFKSEDPNSQAFNISSLSLNFLDSRMEREYLLKRRKKVLKYIRIFYFLCWIILSIYATFHFFWYPITTINYIKLVPIGIGFLFGLFLITRVFEMFYIQMTMIIVCCAILTKIIFDWLFSYYKVFPTGALIFLIYSCLINLNINALFVLVMNLVHLLSLLIMIISNSFGLYTNFVEVENVFDLETRYKVFIAVSLIILQIAFVFVSYFLNYTTEKEKKNVFLDSFKTSSNFKKSQDILSILVPNFVQRNMNKGLLTMSEEQEQVSIMFVDISNFDEIIKETGSKIVPFLDTLFRVYDSLCISNGVQKVETVGKTYMVASGLKIYEIDIPESTKYLSPPDKLLKLGFDILKYLNEVTILKGYKIQAKIGIHCGNVIAGVIGYHKPQFSLIGDTVNTASRVCSTADVNVVTISQESISKYGKNMQYSYKERVVQAKGKGDLMTYQVELFTAENSDFCKKIKKAMHQIKEESKTNIKKKKENLKINQMASFFSKNSDYIDKPSSLKKAGKSFKEMESQFTVSEKKYLPEESKKEITNEKKEENVDNDKKIDVVKVEMEENEEKEEKDDIEEAHVLQKNILRPKGKFMRISYSQNNVYQRFMTENLIIYLKEIRVLILVLFSCYITRTLFLINVLSTIDYSFLIYVFRSIFNLMFLIPALKLPITTMKTLNFYKLFMIFICFLGYFEIFLELQLIQIPQNLTCAVLEGFLIYVIHSNLIIYSLFETLIISVLFIFIMFLSLIMGELYSIEDFTIITLLVFFNMVKLNFSLRTRIKSFNNRILEEERKQHQEELISQLIPKHVYEKLRKVMNNHKVDLSDRFENVTILFADIAGFTKYSSSVRPNQVVDMLRRLFTEFDKRCVQHKIYKVYTIGDCYVAIGMLNSEERNPIKEAKNIISFGFSMISIIKAVREDIDFKDLDMRIGVHTGQIIGGIVGTNLVRYDIYGQDVLIANKMESNGLIGNIMISSDTKKLLEKDNEDCQYQFSFKKEVFVKNLERSIECFLINQGNTL